MASIDLSQLDDFINKLRNIPEQADQVLADTLNYAGEHLTTQAVEMITQELNLDESYVREKITVRQKATINRFNTIVSAHQRGLLLSHFDARQMRKPGKSGQTVNNGVSVQIKRNGPRRHMQSAFFIRLKKKDVSNAGSTGVAFRPGKNASRSSFNKREWNEIGERGYAVLNGPSVSQAFTVFTDELMRNSMDNPMDYFLKRLEKLGNL